MNIKIKADAPSSGKEQPKISLLLYILMYMNNIYTIGDEGTGEGWYISLFSLHFGISSTPAFVHTPHARTHTHHKFVKVYEVKSAVQ